MADNDDTNKSNKPINGEFKHLFQSRDDRQDYASISNLEGPEKLASQIREAEKLLKLPNSKDHYQHIIENIEQISGDQSHMIEQLQESENIKGNRALVQGIRTKTRFGNVNTRTTTKAGSASIARRVAQNPKDLYQSSEQLEEQNRILMEDVGTIGETMADRAKGLDVGDSAGEEFKGDVSLIAEKEEQIAYNKHLMRQQNRKGLTTEKLINRGDDLDDAVSSYLNKKGVEDRVNKGETKSYTEEFNSMISARSDRSSARAAHDAAANDPTANMGEFVEKLKEANDALDEQTKLVKKMSDKGLDKIGTTSDKFRTIGGFAGAISMGAQAAGTIGVNYEIEQTQQRTAYANMANRQYENTRSMSQGDMGSFLRLTKTDSFAKTYSDSLRERAFGFKTAEASAQLAQGVANGIAEGTDPLGMLRGGKKVLAIANAIADPGIRGGLLATRLAYKTAQGEAGIQADAAAQALGNAVNAIPAATMNAYVGGTQGFYKSAQGIGAGRGDFMKNMKGGINDFTLAGKSYEEAAQLGGVAINQIGVTEDATKAALKAAKAEQRGVMGAGQYLGMASQLSDVGGGTGTMEDAMAKAVQMGMENAKNLNQMVSGIVGMASASAAVGVNTVDIAQDRLTSSVAAMRERGVSENLAIGAVGNAYNSFKGAEKERGNFADDQLNARIHKSYGGKLGWRQRGVIANMTSEQIKLLKEGGDEAQHLADQAGISKGIGLVNGKYADKNDQKAIDDIQFFTTQRTLMNESGNANALSLGKNALDDYTNFKLGRSGGKLSDEVRAGHFMVNGNFAETYQVDGKSDEKGKTTTNMSLDESAMQRTYVIGARFKQQEFEAGNKAVDGKDIGGLTELANAMTAIVNANKPGEMNKEVQKAAKNLAASGTTFDRASKKIKDGAKQFETTIVNFMTYMDNLGVGGDKSVLNKLPAGDSGKKKSGAGTQKITGGGASGGW